MSDPEISPIIPTRTSDESESDLRELDESQSRDAQIEADRPPHHG